MQNVIRYSIVFNFIVCCGS